MDLIIHLILKINILAVDRNNSKVIISYLNTTPFDIANLIF